MSDLLRQPALVTGTGKFDLELHEYIGQPCDALAMGSSDAQLLTAETPAHLLASWNGEDEDDDDFKKANIGTVIHLLILEPFRKESGIVVVDAKTFQSNAAKEQRDEALANHKTPILRKDYGKALSAARAVLDHPIAGQLLKDGEAEKSWFWKDPETGLYRKARPDFYTSKRIALDIKTVGSASPDFLKRRVFDGGWFQQAPWHCEVIERVEGEPARGYCWICVEQKPPHAVVVRKPPYAVLSHGKRLNDKAWETFVRCAIEQRWPAYGDEIEELGIPDHAYYRLEEAALQEESTAMDAVKHARANRAHPFS